MLKRDLSVCALKNIRKALMRWIFCLFALFAACSSQPKDELKHWMEDTDGKLRVLSTTAMIDDMAKGIGGDQVKTLVLIKGDLDPHSYQLVKGDQEKLLTASVILANGLNLEHGPSLKNFLITSSRAYFLGDYIAKEDPDQILRFKGETDPHIWMDISLWQKAIPLVVKALSDARPTKKEYFEAQGEKLKAEYAKKHEEIKAILAEIPADKRYLVTSHDAFNYFARAYLSEPGEKDSWSERFQAPEGLAPDSQLSLNDIRHIVEHLKKYNIHIIFPESNLSPDSLKKIIDAAGREGVTVTLGNPYLYGDAMGPVGSDGDTYLKMIEHNARTIRDDIKEASP